MRGEHWRSGRSMRSLTCSLGGQPLQSPRPAASLDPGLVTAVWGTPVGVGHLPRSGSQDAACQALAAGVPRGVGRLPRGLLLPHDSVSSLVAILILITGRCPHAPTQQPRRETGPGAAGRAVRARRRRTCWQGCSPFPTLACFLLRPRVSHHAAGFPAAGRKQRLHERGGQGRRGWPRGWREGVPTPALGAL